MRRIGLIISYSVCLFSTLYADPIDGYWQQKVDYDMEITLVDTLQQLTGFTTIKYTNNSPDSLDRFYMHLYPNAFQLESVKYREYIGNAGRASRAKYFKDRLDGFTSKIDVHDFSVALPKEGASWIHKTPILDTYKIDDTILEAKLLEKIAPGRTVQIDLNWTHHVGEMVERGGYYEGQYNMAQWYPKMVVYDEDGWNADVFHAEGEFYGEFGNFEVKFDLPKAFIIAASGVVTDGDPGWESVTVDTSFDFDVWVDIYDSTYVKPDSSERRTVTFLAENVHDFAWVASKDFLYEGGKHNDIDVHVLYDKGRGEKWTKDVLERSIRAISWLEEKFGKYPYPQVTTTDRIKSGGMEYPMLVMNGRESEGLIVHEYGHIYFYGILANNEVDEAWLDEGFTTTQTSHYLMNRYGHHGFDLSLDEDRAMFPKKYWPLEHSLHSDQWSAISFMRSGHDENISRASYLYNNGSAYGRNAYTKPALMLTELKYLLEDSLYYGAMQHYYDKWKLKHVNEQRFVDAIEEYTGEELDWFFDAWLHTTHHLDYGISSFRKTNKDGKWTIDLGIESKGARFMPLLVETTFEDGTTDRRWWKNHLWRYEDTFNYSVDKKPVSVTIDPDVQTVDLDFRNNTTNMKNRLLFNWPGLWYEPRDERVYRWMPSVYYYADSSDFAPGLTIDRDYGPYESITMRANYALQSNNLYWYVSGWRQPVHFFPRTTFYYWGYNRPGVKEYGGEVEKKWDRVYGRTPTHTFAGGFYVQPEYDELRASALGYDASGKVAVGYFNWNSTVGPLDLSLNGATTLGPVSTWEFNRLTASGTFEHKKTLGIENKKRPDLNRNFTLYLKQRFIGGKIWAGDLGVPGQEGYNIEGNSSNDMIRKNYLVDQFYGQDTLFAHYHMPGEGNLRGFVGKGERGAEALMATSSEISIYKNLSKADKTDIILEFAAFIDGGLFWNRLFLDPMDESYRIGSTFNSRTLADGGVGLRLKTDIFEKDLYLRIDLPFFIHDNEDSSFDNFENWIISFQRSI
ncbi:MAG: M1 family metallopeptidase [Candidatus Marinimicrobia bacterium]|nr:M1 family metallopeptidase [Candidatus Neomarinimicrobiota bacterium]